MKQEIRVVLWFNIIIIFAVFLLCFQYFERTGQWAIFFAPLIIAMFYQPIVTLTIDEE